MSAYEDVLRAAADEAGVSYETALFFFAGVLESLPPSIVVDGRVVELEAAVAVLLSGNPHNGVVQAMAEGLANAAREVAE